MALNSQTVRATETLAPSSVTVGPDKDKNQAPTADKSLGQDRHAIE